MFDQHSAIPAGWRLVSLGEIADIDNDNLPNNTPPKYEINYISLENIERGHLTAYQPMQFGNAPSRARRRLKKGDVLFATVRPNLLSHYIFQFDQDNFVCSTGFSVIRACPEKTIPAFIYYHLFADIINAQVSMLLAGSNYPAINSRDVKRLVIPLPSLQEQAAIAEALGDVDTMITSLTQLLAKKRVLQQGMMQQLLSGRIRLG